MDNLQQKFNKLLRETRLGFYRYMYHKINWGSQLIGLTGPRGVGKTTMLLQHIKNNLNATETLYVTAEDFYFAENKLIDLADRFVKLGGKYLFIDEIHKYNDWSRELKLIYDYHSELKVVFTGSSVLDINKGVADLSRRAVMYNMQGLSFREYLELFHKIKINRLSLSDALTHNISLPVGFKPLAYFGDYLKRGYYPFALNADFDIRMRQVVNQTLETDIPLFADINISTARKLKQLLSIISRSVPFKPNMSSIAAALGASRNNIADYNLYLEEAGFITQLRNATGGIRGLGKVDKIYLDNTNLIYSLAAENPEIGNVRETFFINQMRVNHDVVSSQVGDFKLGDYIFEFDGKNKKRKQIEGIANAYVVKDDIEFGYLNTVPLWALGMMY